MIQIDFNSLPLIVGTLVTLALMVAFFVYQIRRQDLKLLRESIDDLTGRVVFLEAENKRLTHDAETNLSQRKYLEQIVVQALSLKLTTDETLRVKLEDVVDGKK